MKRKLISLVSILVCIFMLTAMLPINASAMEEGKKGTFFAYLFGYSNETDNILKPYDLKSANLYSKGAKAVAKETAFYLKMMPEGRRAIDIHGISYDIMDNKENVVWWDNGTEAVREHMIKYFSALKDEGVELDYIIDDMEGDMSNWSIKKQEVADSIVNDPRYLTDIRPELESRGFRFGTEEQGDLYYVVHYTKDKTKTAYNMWNRAMDGDRLATYHNRAFYDVAKEYFPDVKLSNYSSTAYNGEAKIISGASHRTYLGGAGKTHIGTHSSPVCYGSIVHLAYAGYAPEWYTQERFWRTAYNALLLDTMKCQSAVLSTKNGGLMPWIGLRDWSNSSGSYGNFFSTDYYQEFLFHAGLLNPDPFLIYNAGSSQEGDDLKLIQNIMYQLDELCGFEDRKPLVTEAVDWNRRYVLSGMYAGGKNVWRITPDLYAPGVSLENFLVDKENMIFQIGNEIVDFPDGSYIYTPKQNLSAYGYWVISPKGTYPEEFIADGIAPALDSVETEDFIPTGYMYTNDSVTYNPNLHKPSSGEVKEEVKDEAPGSEQTNPSVAIPEHWAKQYLAKAVEAKIIEGSEQGLMPDRNISRAEIITMLLRAFGLEADKNAGPNWYDGPIATAKSLGWIEPYDDGPTIIDRQETARIMVRAFHVGVTSRRVTFTDIADVSPEMLDSVLDAASSGIINGTPDGSFKPRANITRAEAITMIMRSLN